MKKRPKTSGKPGARARKFLRLGPIARARYERKLARDRERLRRIYHERRSLVDRWSNGRCAACGTELAPDERDIDHVDASLKRLPAHQPHRSGWLEEARENMQPLCLGCHVAKTRVDRAKRAAQFVERAQQERADGVTPF